MAKGIEDMAARKQDEERRKEEEELSKGKRNYTPVSSFLTQRQIDPDGTPRRAGQTTPRSLADIVGEENIFAILHKYFVALLKCLGERFGGLPLADKPMYHSVVDEERVLKQMPQDTRQKAAVRKMEPIADDEIDAIKNRIKKDLSLQCGPNIGHSTMSQRQAVM